MAKASKVKLETSLRIVCGALTLIFVAMLTVNFFLSKQTDGSKVCQIPLTNYTNQVFGLLLFPTSFGVSVLFTNLHSKIRSILLGRYFQWFSTFAAVVVSVTIILLFLGDSATIINYQVRCSHDFIYQATSFYWGVWGMLLFFAIFSGTVLKRSFQDLVKARRQAKLLSVEPRKQLLKKFKANRIFQFSKCGRELFQEIYAPISQEIPNFDAIDISYLEADYQFVLTSADHSALQQIQAQNKTQQRAKILRVWNCSDEEDGGEVDEEGEVEEQIPRAEEDATACGICKQHLEVRTIVISTPDCSHYFHRSCYLSWIASSIYCCLCHSDLLHSMRTAVCSPSSNSKRKVTLQKSYNLH